MALKLSTPINPNPQIALEKTQRNFQRISPPLLIPSRNFTGSRFSPFPTDAGILNCCNGGRLVVAHAQQSQSSSTVETQMRDVSPSSKLVLVVGGTGGVGQLIVANLLSRNIKSRLLLRDPMKAVSLFGVLDEDKLQVHKADTRNPGDLDPAIFEGVTHVICCTGTTAFPSKRWERNNTPETVDWEGIRNLVLALPPTLKRFVLVSSVGVTKCNELPWRCMPICNLLVVASEEWARLYYYEDACFL